MKKDSFSLTKDEPISYEIDSYELDFPGYYVQREKRKLEKNPELKKSLLLALKNNPDAVIAKIRSSMEGDIMSAVFETGKPCICNNMDALSKIVFNALKKEFLE